MKFHTLILTSIFSVLIVYSTSITYKHKSLKDQVSHLKQENLLLKRETISLKKQNTVIKKELEKHLFERKYHHILRYTKEADRIREDIKLIPEDYRDKVLALCWTESHLKYNVSHPWGDTTTGICGIKSRFWKDFVTKSGAEINSLYAGFIVLKYLEDKANGDFFQAVKKYKGAVNNLYPVHKAVNLYKKLARKEQKWQNQSSLILVSIL